MHCSKRFACSHAGIQQAMEQLLETKAFQETSGPTLRRLCGAHRLTIQLMTGQ
jgi:membrane-bound inhibitor of C-type lysozyme